MGESNDKTPPVADTSKTGAGIPPTMPGSSPQSNGIPDLRAIAAESAPKSKRGGARPGAGRKPNEARLADAASSAPVSPANRPEMPTGEELEQAAYIEALATDIIQMVSESRVDAVVSLCKGKIPDDMLKRFESKAAMSPGVQKIVPPCAKRLALKYALLGAYGDEICLAVCLLGDYARWQLLLKDLNALLKPVAAPTPERENKPALTS